MKWTIFYLNVLFLIISFVGCVTQKKYDDLLAAKVKLDAEVATLQDSLEAANLRIGHLEKTVAHLKSDTARQGEALQREREALRLLQDEHGQLETYYNNLLNNSGKLNRDLAQQQERLMALKEDLELIRGRNEALSADLSAREKRVRELEEVLKSKEEAVNALKNKITDALLNFKESDLTVELKNGKVYVSLAEQLLFASGSVKVDTRGVKALQQLARAVKDQPDINIMVEGHTDDVPISRVSQYMRDNWDLSVMRATSIVRILTAGGVSPQQITASGKGEFSPLTDNDTTEGKQKNRRTEIILTPNLDELFQILESN